MKNKEAGDTVPDQKRLGGHDNEMQCGALGWILQQEENISGEGGKVQIKS